MNNDAWELYEYESYNNGKGKGKGKDWPVVPESDSTGAIITGLLLVFILIIHWFRIRKK